MIHFLLFLNFLGTGEFLLIALVGILLFGPEKIPGLARSMAQTIRKVKDAGDDIKKEIHATAKEANVVEEVNKQVKEIEDLTHSVKRNLNKNINIK
ncbi:MAG: twin-arginine translocase TatA/TatE family subunit [Flavobacteriales bacterium]|nr:twin-arginine translocase TatA/TatE family subunit [Flavobacteriales bacterium]